MWNSELTDKIKLKQEIRQGSKLFTIMFKRFNNGLLPSLSEINLLIGPNIGTNNITSPTCTDDLTLLDHSLKLYCRYKYTRLYMINRIWSLKQLWLQVNGHAWFHLHGLCWPVRNGEGAKNSKWKYMFSAGFETTPRQSTTGKSAP